MLKSRTALYERLSATIDDFMVLDYTGVGSIGMIYAALQKRQPGSMCMAAAEMIVGQVAERPGPVLIATGFPEGGGVPETDGPVAALACLVENHAVFHEPELEVRCIEACVASGGVDGMFMGPEPATDGIAAEEWRGLIQVFRKTLQRHLGMVTNWQGQSGDWRQIRA
ncbi:hypothetical protein [Gluconobacter kondonii]|uniref:hypothetical protein n=1 Tax=Gluconobacter kondonii TaxID=941463 RepID=UPI001B8B29F8|nr:hypothetical protein [Gluconobacter kondonii]MBS1081287.1 hypothetical protein [Gluconobacter kondonii]